MTAKFTQGAWELVKYNEIIADGDMLLCTGVALIGGCHSKREEAIANTRLIAAAPDLLDALVMVRDADEDCHRDRMRTIPPAARAKIDAAIAKALGQNHEN